MTGRVLAIHRFPVKSMLGETVAATELDASGLVGDRAYALIDSATHKVASAKHPDLWSGLLGLRAAFVGEAKRGAPITVRLADGTTVRSDDVDVHQRLSQAVGRAVQLATAPAPGAAYDDVWPEVEGLAPQAFIDGTRSGVSAAGRPISTLPVGALAPGTFQDLAPVTLMTTATLRAASRLYPTGRWDSRRFRANLIVDVDADGFVENHWSGRQLTIGDIVLQVLSPTPRCVMTTLAQEDLPADPGILRTVARHNRLEIAAAGGAFACLGTYAQVVQAGRVTVGSSVGFV